MKTDVSPIIISILFLFVFVSALLFLSSMIMFYKELEIIRKRLGDKVFNWLIGEVEDDKM